MCSFLESRCAVWALSFLFVCLFFSTVWIATSLFQPGLVKKIKTCNSKRGGTASSVVPASRRLSLFYKSVFLRGLHLLTLSGKRWDQPGRGAGSASGNPSWFPAAGKGESITHEPRHWTIHPSFLLFSELFAGGCVQSEHKCKCLHEECSIHNEVKHEIAAV